MRIYLLLLLSVFLIACQAPKPGPGEQLDHLFDEYHQFLQGSNPLEASKSGNKTYNDTLSNFISESFKEGAKERYQYFLEGIADIDTNQLSAAQLLSLKVMKWDCNIKKEGLENELSTVTSPIYNLPNFQYMPVTQITSLQLYFSQIAAGHSVHPFESVKDYEDWLQRVADYLAWIDSAIANMKLGMAKGQVLPKVLVERVLDQLAPFIKAPLREHLFYQPIRQMPASINEEDQERLRRAYGQMIERDLKPKYDALHTFMKEIYLPACRESSGLVALPAGRETYDFLIRLHTSTNMSADEIFELGQQEVKRIRGEMDKVIEEIGFEGDLNAFLEHVRSNPDLIPFKEPQEVIDNFKAIHERMKPQLLELFAIAPKAGFVIKRTEAFREKSASAEYVPGSKDATRPGTFYVPIPDVRSYNVFSDEALFLHEAIPGHHFQLSLQQENQELPEFLHPESIGVYVEGWALYCESLGKELGLYTDPYQYFGMLSMEMHRAIRLVVDAGIHAKGWTREEAIQYSLENEAASEASITSEIERYMATPGQALSYKIGQLTIRRLREKAEMELGADFDIKAFHSQVLDSGSLPMFLLEEKIEDWIKGRK